LVSVLCDGDDDEEEEERNVNMDVCGLGLKFGGPGSCRRRERIKER